MPCISAGCGKLCDNLQAQNCYLQTLKHLAKDIYHTQQHSLLLQQHQTKVQDNVPLLMWLCMPEHSAKCVGVHSFAMQTCVHSVVHSQLHISDAQSTCMQTCNDVQTVTAKYNTDQHTRGRQATDRHITDRCPGTALLLKPRYLAAKKRHKIKLTL